MRYLISCIINDRRYEAEAETLEEAKEWYTAYLTQYDVIAVIFDSLSLSEVHI